MPPKKKQINKPPKAARQRTTALSPIPKNLAEGKRSRTTLPTGPTKKEIMALNNEIKAFADEMLAAKKITQEEYNELVGEIER